MDISKKNYWILIAIFLLLSVIVYPISFREEVWPSGLKLGDFPREIGDWKVTLEEPISEEFLPESRGREGRPVGIKILNRQYTDKEGNSLWLYIGYFNYQQGPSHHNPARCYVSQGWSMIEEDFEDIKLSNNRDVKINKIFVQRGPLQEIVLYWYQMGDNIITNKFRHQLRILAKAFIRGRSDGVVISLTSDTEKGHIEDIVNYGKDFAKEIIPLIPKYIPN